MIPPYNIVFLAYDSIVSHDLHPVFLDPIYIEVPNFAKLRVLLIFKRNGDYSLNVIVDILFAGVEKRHKTRVEKLALFLVKCEQIHDMCESQFWLFRSCDKFPNLFRVRVFHLHDKTRQVLMDFEACSLLLFLWLPITAAEQATSAASLSTYQRRRVRVCVTALSPFCVCHRGSLVL